MPLTDTRIRSLKPRETPYKVADGGGLYIEVKPSGGKLWRLRYRIAGKENIFAIGSYPAVNLSTARTERDEAKKLIKQGVHPAHKRNLDKIRQASEHANTFQSVAEEWLIRNSPKWTPATLEQRRKALEADVYKYIGTMPVNQVTPAHVLDIIQRVEARAPTMAVLVKQSMGAIFRYAITTLRADIDPTAPLRDALKPHKPQHSRPLAREDIPAFFKALEGQTFTTRTAFDLIWLTLARTNEVLNAKWTELNLEAALWVIPASRMKMREAHRIPLPRQAVTILRQLHAVTGDSEYLFPHQRSRKRPATAGILRKTVYRIGYQQKFSPHGIRSTASTILNELNYRADLVETQLAHAERNKSRKAYNRADYLEERRDMMQAWANYLDGLKAGDSKVIPMKRGA